MEEHLQRRARSAAAAEILPFQHDNSRADAVSRQADSGAAGRGRRRGCSTTEFRAEPAAAPAAAAATQVLQIRPLEAQPRPRLFLRAEGGRARWRRRRTQ